MKAIALGYLFATVTFSTLGAQDEKQLLSTPIRTVKDIDRIDLVDIFVDQNFISAICRVESKGIDHKLATVIDGNTGELIEAPGGDKGQIGATGDIIVLTQLNGNTLKGDKRIHYHINFHMLPDKEVYEEVQPWSPLNVEGNYLCVVRWPKTASLVPLTQMPDVFLISPEYEAALKRVDPKDLVNKRTSHVSKLFTVENVVHLLMGEDYALGIEALKSTIDRSPLRSGEQIKLLLPASAIPIVGAVIVFELIEQTNYEAVLQSSNLIREHYANAKNDLALRNNIALALMLSQASPNPYADAFEPLKADLITSLRAEPVTERTKAILSRLQAR